MFYSNTIRPQPHRYIYVGTPDNLKQRTDVSVEREFSCGVGFSGRGSVGVLRRKGERKSEIIPNSKRAYEPSFVEYKYTTPCGTDSIVRVSLCEKPPVSYLVKSFNRSQALEYLSGLAIRCKFQRALDRENVSSRNKRVASGLTRRGKRVIADGISLLEYKYGNRRLGFYTLTCPYTDSADIQVFNDNYSLICKRYLEWVKRQYKAKGLLFNYVGVHEIQPKRFADTGDQCLHLHYVAPALDSRGRFFLLHREMVGQYRRIIEQVCGIRLDRNPRLDAQLVKRSASAYLAKYYSKGVDIDSTISTGRAIARLSSWYTVSRSLLVAIRRTTIQLPELYSLDLFKSSANGTRPSYVDYLSPVYVEWEGSKFHVGCVFRLDREFMSKLRELVFPHVVHFV